MSFQLAVNTCQTHAEIALFDSSQLVALTSWEKSKSHSEVITELFCTLLQDHSISLKQIDKVYCVTGPGSFTGIRVGVSFSKSIAYSLKIPMVSLNQLDLLATNCMSSEHPVLSVLDAQKNSIFCSLYFNDNKQFTPVFQNKVVSIDELPKVITKNVVVVGNGIDLYKKQLSEELLQKINFHEDIHSSLKNIFKSPVAAQTANSLSWYELQPLYIKASAPEEKLNPTKTKL